jgi:glycine cleavage system H protein
MLDFLEFQVDKFIFKVASDRLYSDEGMWVKLEDPYIRVGISDYLQQRSGDVAFAEIKPEGTVLAIGDELAVIETIKVNISLTSPVEGRVIEVNPEMETSPDVINQDPYGTGWMAVIDLTGMGNNLKHLLDAQTYYSQIKREAEQEVKKNDQQ